MRVTKLDQLIGKLNSACRSALDEAVKICGLRSNPTVEVEHWLQALLSTPGTDLSRICNEYKIDTDRLATQVMNRLDRLRRGSSDTPRLSERVLEWIGQAWVIASIDHRACRISSGHLTLALFSNEQFAPIAELTELSRIPQPALANNLTSIVKDSFESDLEGAVAKRGQHEGFEQPEVPHDQSSLGQFTMDLTALAKGGGIDPVTGRDAEIRQIIDILTRRRQNNPILTGEAGVGKTAVVEGFALRIAEQDVPEALKQVRLLSLDLGALQAGAGVKGEFERRLKGVIDEVKSSPVPIILFIDEAHNMVGAGGQAGSGDAANLLKPALARGELRTIAATTWLEYTLYFEKDAALSRRFQVVRVEEPDHDVAIEMMQGLLPTLEKHHSVTITPKAVEASVELSGRYIAGRQLPDKSVSVLDTTCARVALSQSTTPPQIEDTRRKIRSLEISREIEERQSKTGKGNPQRLQQINDEIEKLQESLNTLVERWEKELLLSKKIQEITRKLLSDGSGCEEKESDPASELSPAADENESPQTDQARENLADVDTAVLLQHLQEAEKSLAELQGERPLVHQAVTEESVAETIESWTGIPLGRMVSDELETVLNLKENMEDSIIGQSHALDLICERILTARAGMRDPRTPIGVFMLAGTSGVGKTETAIALAELLYGGEQNMTVINMSEFKEEHKVSQLMGPPPGYKGYEEGGVLTNAVRRKPYSVVLLDEIEKAHEGVQEIFYQVFDKGILRDGQGRDVDFKNTVILITTNAASDFIASLCADPETMPSPKAFLSEARPELLKVFKPAFLNRTTVIPYYPLSDQVLQKIVRLKLAKVERRVTSEYNASCVFEDDVIAQIADRCTDADAGARNIDHIVNNTLLPLLSRKLLGSLTAETPFQHVRVTLDSDGQFEIAFS